MKLFCTKANVYVVSLKEDYYVSSNEARIVSAGIADVLQLSAGQHRSLADTLSRGLPFDFSECSQREISVIKGVIKWCRGYFVRKGSSLVTVDLNSGKTFVLVRSVDSYMLGPKVNSFGDPCDF